MQIAGIIFIPAVSYILGTSVLCILRERKAGHTVRCVTGLFAVILYFFACMLVSLKLDLSFDTLEKLFLIPLLAVTAAGLVFI